MKRKQNDEVVIEQQDNSNTEIYSGKDYDKKYNRLHKDMKKLSVDEIYEWLKYFRRYNKVKNDYFDIGIHACVNCITKKLF